MQLNGWTRHHAAWVLRCWGRTVFIWRGGRLVKIAEAGGEDEAGSADAAPVRCAADAVSTGAGSGGGVIGSQGAAAAAVRESQQPPAHHPAPASSRSRPQRWQEAVRTLLDLQAEYQAWLDNLPASLQELCYPAKADD